MEKIKFSIVIPTYNRADFIKATVKSVLQQDYANFELIIVDDGSTDNTEDIIDSIHDERLKYYKKINEERSIARNYGFSKAIGDYVVFFDSDDLMLANHLSTLNEAIVKLGYEVNFIATKYNLSRNNLKIDSGLKNYKQGWYSIDSILNGNIFGCQVCVKKDNPKLHLFKVDQYIAEDWIFLMQNLRYDKIFLIDKITISMNDHENRSMRKENHQIIIQQNLKAYDWIVHNIQLTKIQIHTLTSYIYYFCAIHSYIGNNRKNAINFLRKTIAIKGFGKKEVILYIKILIGYRILRKLSSWFK